MARPRTSGSEAPRAPIPADARKAALGLRARAARLAAGWTLDSLAERSGLEVRHLQYVEAGQANITLDTLYKLADGLGISCGQLVDEPSATPPTTDMTEGPLGDSLVDVEEILRRVAVHVATLRRGRSLTQQSLADAADVPLRIIKDLESAHPSPTLRALVSVAAALSLPPASLLGPAPAEPLASKPRVRSRRT